MGAGGVQEGSKGNKGKLKCKRADRLAKPLLHRKAAFRPRRVRPVNRSTNSCGKDTRRALHLIGRIVNLPKPIVRYTLRVKSLGAGLAPGVARNCTVMLHRLRLFQSRLSRFKMLRQAGVNTAMLVRTGGLAALMYGYMAPWSSPLRTAAAKKGHQRSCIPQQRPWRSGVGHRPHDCRWLSQGQGGPGLHCPQRRHRALGQGDMEQLDPTKRPPSLHRRCQNEDRRLSPTLESGVRTGRRTRLHR